MGLQAEEEVVSRSEGTLKAVLGRAGVSGGKAELETGQSALPGQEAVALLVRQHPLGTFSSQGKVETLQNTEAYKGARLGGGGQAPRLATFAFL